MIVEEAMFDGSFERSLFVTWFRNGALSRYPKKGVEEIFMHRSQDRALSQRPGNYYTGIKL
jgi:hypothetical protein